MKSQFKKDLEEQQDIAEKEVETFKTAIQSYKI
jgi:uncharacterized protein (DUF3084 family)